MAAGHVAYNANDSIVRPGRIRVKVGVDERSVEWESQPNDKECDEG